MKKIFDIQNLSQKLSNSFQFDVRALAFFRIAFGFAMLLDLCIRLSDFKAFYTQDGVLPYNYLIQFFDKYLYVPIYQLNDSPWFVGVCFALHLGAVFCFTIGYKTKLFQVITLLFYISLHMRNPYLLQGGDDLLRCMLFFTLFIPLNTTYAIQKKAVNTQFHIPVLVLMFQVMMVYWVSALMKTSTEWHSDGTALYYAFNLDFIQWPLAKYLLNFPASLKVLTHVVFYLELLVPLLFFIPFYNHRFRFIGIIILCLFQIGIASTLFVGLFFLFNLIALIPFLPSFVFNYFKCKTVHLNEPLIISPIKNKMVGFVLLYVLIWNTTYIPQLKYGIAKKLKVFAYPLGINQNWGMFAPSVFKDDGWFIYEVITTKGDSLDLNNNYHKITYTKPENILSTIKNDRWRKYNEYIVLADRTWLRKPLKEYILKKHYANKTYHHLQLKKFYLVYMMELTPKPGDSATISHRYLTD